MSSRATDPAGGDHRDVHGLGQGLGGRDIHSPFDPVPGDVGIDKGRGLKPRQGLGHVQGGHLAGLGPALHGQEAVFGIQAENDAAGIIGAGPGRQVGVLEGHGAQDEAVDARGQYRPR